MNAKVLIEVDVQHEAIVRQALAMSEEMQQLALSAEDGNVVTVCELAVIEKGRQLQRGMLGEAVARRIEATEKRGRRSGPVHADVRKKTEAPNNAIS